MLRTSLLGYGDENGSDGKEGGWKEVKVKKRKHVWRRQIWNDYNLASWYSSLLHFSRLMLWKMCADYQMFVNETILYNMII